MRIGILGNMNNNSNNLIKYLLDAGMDAELLFFENEARHFRPEADNVDGIEYPMTQLGWGSYKKLWMPIGSQVRRDLAKYDFLIGSRLAPAYLTRFGCRPLDIFMPTGGDIWTVPVFSGLQIRNLLKYFFVSGLQYKGIQNSSAIFFDKTNPETESVIAPVVAGVPRYEHPIPMLYLPDFEHESLKRRRSLSHSLHRFEKIRSETDLLIMHHVKHLWCKRSVMTQDPLQEKGNDRIVHALRAFVDGIPNADIRIVMFEYGPDFQATKDLAEQLGVSRYIAWFPRTERKEIMLAISLSDAVIGELARSWFSYGTVIEAMAMAKPVIHNRDDDYFSEKTLYPMLQASTVEDLVRVFRQLSADKSIGPRIGQHAHAWLKREGIQRPINDIQQLLDLKSRRPSAMAA